MGISATLYRANLELQLGRSVGRFGCWMGAAQPKQDMAQEKMILYVSSEFSVLGIGNPSIGWRY